MMDDKNYKDKMKNYKDKMKNYKDKMDELDRLQRNSTLYFILYVILVTLYFGVMIIGIFIK